MEIINSIFLYNLALICSVMFSGWIFSLIKKQVTHIDSIWGLGFIIIAWNTLYWTQNFTTRSILIAILVTIWGLRLSTHLTLRNWGKGEDRRYNAWRKKNKQRFWIISLFKVFLLQAVFLWVISLVIQYGISRSLVQEITIFEITGIIIWTIGILIESFADWQLKQFLANPTNAGKVMNKYLWKYSRHPNYFGETLIWWGMFILVQSTVNSLWTIISPLVITFTLLKLTGVTLMEKDIVNFKPKYREYIQTTSSFIPWFPKKK